MNAREDLLKHAHTLADIMGKISAGYFYSPITVETKSDKSFVTQADRRTEKAARAYLGKSRPQDRIWGEEYGAPTTGVSPDTITWVIDPIDGTKAFMDGLATWTNLIGVFHGTDLLFGIISQPITGERYWGGPNMPSCISFVDPETGKRIEKSIQCANATSIEQIMWRSTTKDYMTPDDRKAYDALAKISAPREGGDAMLYAALARGRTLNCVFDGNLSVWDIAAPAAIVLGAKGVVTDGTGKPLNFFSGDKMTVLATATQSLHDVVQKVFEDKQKNEGF